MSSRSTVGTSGCATPATTRCIRFFFSSRRRHTRLQGAGVQTCALPIFFVTIKLMTELRDLLDEDFEVQTMQVSATAVLQARKSSTLRDITGLSAALTIKITPETGGTRVEIGMQKWFDKAAVAAVALLLSAGLLIALPALGAYWQYKLTEDAWKIIESHVSHKAGGYVPPMP